MRNNSPKFEKVMFMFVAKGGVSIDGSTLYDTADEAWQKIETKTSNPKSWLMGQGHRVVRCYLDMIEY